jgi:peptidoglycan/LPS O-acetylase OafA/YrhL
VNRRASDFRGKDRLAYIDGLRAIAVLLVMIFHARVHMPSVKLEHVFLEGTHGVDLFFVLSGFCLAAPTLLRLQREGTVRFNVVGYAARRLLRIFPPYAVAVIAFSLVAWYAVSKGIPLPLGMRPHFEWTDVAGELLFFDRTNQHINQSFWSLAIEFRWYFIFPVMVALWAARPRAVLATIFALVVASELTRASSTDIGVMPAFLLGIVAAQIHISRHPIARIAPLLGVVGIGAALLLEQGYHFPIQTNFGWHVVAFALVVTAGREVWLQRVLGQRWLTAIGLASYSIYLVHEPIISASVGILAPRIGGIAAFFAAIGLGLLGGWIMWAIVERPITDRAVVAAFVAWASPPLRRFFGFAGIPFEVNLGAVHAAPAVATIGAATPASPTVIEFRPGRERAAES